jgi:hypothetical protein
MHLCILMYVHKLALSVRNETPFPFVIQQTGIFTCLYLFIYIFVYIYIYMYVYIYTYIHVYMYIYNMYIDICI